MTKEIVLARYQEPIDWINSIDRSVIITVYNKSGDANPGWLVSDWIQLENQGREAGTYFEHIIRRYESLSDVTFFFQADPRPHLNNIPQPTQYEPPNGFDWLVNHIAADGRDGAPNHHGLPLGDFYTDVFKREPPEEFSFGAGACFAVEKWRIQSKPLEFYQRVYDLCRNTYTEFYPWIMERMWAILLTEDL